MDFVAGVTAMLPYCTARDQTRASNFQVKAVEPTAGNTARTTSFEIIIGTDIDGILVMSDQVIKSHSTMASTLKRPLQSIWGQFDAEPKCGYIHERLKCQNRRRRLSRFLSSRIGRQLRPSKIMGRLGSPDDHRPDAGSRARGRATLVVPRYAAESRQQPHRATT